MKKIFNIFLISLFIGVISIAMLPQKTKAVSADVKTLYPTEDSWLDAANPNTNDNLSPDLFVARNAEGIAIKESAIKFDLSTIPAGATLTSASFNLFLRACTGNYSYLTIYQIDADITWTESSATWNSNLASMPESWFMFSNTDACIPERWYYINTIDIVKNWLSGQTNNGFLVMPVSYVSGAMSRTFYSRHNTNFKPQLVLAYTYTPADTTPPPADTPTTAAPESNTSDNASSGNTNSSATTTATTASIAKKTVDTSIAPPTLEYMIQGETRTAAPIVNEVAITTGDIIKIGGKSFANAGIAVMIGEKAFTGLADKSGLWELTIDTKEIAAGSYKIMAQAQDIKKDKGSAEAELFSIKINDKEAASEEKTAVETNKKLSLFEKLTDIYKWHTLAGLIVLTFCCFGVLYYLLKKRKLSGLNQTQETANKSPKESVVK